VTSKIADRFSDIARSKPFCKNSTTLLRRLSDDQGNRRRLAKDLGK
jgi:hypothetical protein